MSSAWPGDDSRARLPHSVQRRNLVPGRVPEVRQVEPGFVPLPGWVLTGRAAVGDACRVPGVRRFRAGGDKPDRAAVAMAGWVAIDRFAQREDSVLGPVEAPSLLIDYARLVAQRAEHRVVKPL